MISNYVSWLKKHVMSLNRISRKVNSEIVSSKRVSFYHGSVPCICFGFVYPHSSDLSENAIDFCTKKLIHDSPF